MKTSSALAFLSLCFIANSQKETKKVKVTKLEYNLVERITVEKYHYIDGGTKPWLFSGDVAVFAFIGAAIWAIDIIWVANRGMLNKKIYSKKGVSSFNKLNDKLSFGCIVTQTIFRWYIQLIFSETCHYIIPSRFQKDE